MKKRAWVVAGIGMLVTGCATAPGTGLLYVLGDTPAVVALTIEGGQTSGRMTATHPKTGERFAGIYTATPTWAARPAQTDVTVNVNSRTRTLRDNMAEGFEAGAAAARNQPQSFRGTAVLVGDQGTAIELEIELVNGYVLHGSGAGMDNRGQRYRVQF